MSADGPNPGSEAARTAGCICAVLDNNHGRSAPCPPDGWWITEGCPVHHPVTIAVQPDNAPEDILAGDQFENEPARTRPTREPDRHEPVDEPKGEA